MAEPTDLASPKASAGVPTISHLREAMANLGISSDLKNGIQMTGGLANPAPIKPAMVKPALIKPALIKPAQPARNTHPAYRERPVDGPADGLPPLSAYDDGQPYIESEDGYREDLPGEDLHREAIHDDPVCPVDVDSADGDGASSADRIIIRFDPSDPRFAWRGFAPGDYAHHHRRGDDMGYAFAHWAASMAVTPLAWRRMMTRLDRQPPATQKAMLHHLDTWMVLIGPDWIALDAHMAALDQDMDLPKEKVQAAMLLVEVLQAAGLAG